MNKTIACLILGVIILAMILIMVNQYTSPPEEAAAPVESAASPSDAPVYGGTTGSGALTPVPPPAALPQGAPQAQRAMPEMAGGAHPSALPQWATNMPEHLPPAVTGPSAATHAAPTPVMGGQNSGAGAGTASATPAQASVPSSSAAAPQAAPSAATAPVKAAPAKTTAPAKPKGPKTIKKIVVNGVKDGVNVRFDGSEPMVYKTMRLNGPERLVIDFQGVWAVKAPGVPGNKYVTNVRIGKQADKTRVVIDLRQPPTSVKFVKSGADDLEVRIR